MVRSSCLLACCALAALLLAVPSFAYPSSNNYIRDDFGQYEPEEIMDMVNRLGNLIRIENRMANDKRAIDLGLGRGYSGALHANHLMGLAAANSANGPGRRRRDAH